jgi:hypothetical protein
MTDTADRILQELRARRDELRPLVDELQRIEAAIDALERAGESAAPAPRQSGAPGDRPRRRGRPRSGEPNRSDQFLELVRRGAISIPEAARELGIGPNYLYRIAGTLETEGTIRKEGRNFVLGVDRPEPEAGGLANVEGVNEGATGLAKE